MAEPVPPEPAHHARQLGRYEVIAEIASGGMGTVVLARLAGAGGFQRLFAIKLLHPHNVADLEFVRMFLDEARIAAKIRHPNVVGIQEIAEDPERGYYLVMDYVDGWSLDALLESLPQAEPARWRVAHRVLLDALSGLDAAHHQRDEATGAPLHVVHRDFSPQNVLVGVDGIARVADFGVAKAAARIATTRAGQVKGKLAYMSPEQARAGTVDARTDVFSAGIMLWEALVAERLFKRASPAATGAAVLSAPIASPASRVAEIPAAISDVAMRALAREPSQRYGSARAMAEALEEAARATGLLASVHEVGVWLRATFGPQIAARRESIRAAMQDDRAADARPLANGLRVPQLGAPARDSITQDSGVVRAEATHPTSSGLPPRQIDAQTASLRAPPPGAGPASDGDTPISDARIVATLLSGRAAPSDRPAAPADDDDAALADEGATELDDAERVKAMLREIARAKPAVARSQQNVPPAPEHPVAPPVGAPASFKLLAPARAAAPSAWDEGVDTTVFGGGGPARASTSAPLAAAAQFDDEVRTDVFRGDVPGVAIAPVAPRAPTLPARTPSRTREVLTALAWVLLVVVAGTALGLGVRLALDHHAASAAPR